MILGGTNIKTQTENNGDVSRAVLSLSQVIVFNSMKRGRSVTVKLYIKFGSRDTASSIHRYSDSQQNKEMWCCWYPFRKRFITLLWQNPTDAVNNIIDLIEKDEVVYPTILQNGLFTTVNRDNIDHNPSSASAHSAFHCIAIPNCKKSCIGRYKCFKTNLKCTVLLLCWTM